MTLAALFPPDRVLRLRGTDKSAVLGELSRRAATALSLPPAEISAALLAREALGSTGIGGGIAVPHARPALVRERAAFFVRLDRAVDWQAIDQRPVDLVFLLLSPATADAEHLAAMSAVTRRLREPGVAASVRAAAEPRDLLAALAG